MKSARSFNFAFLALFIIAGYGGVTAAELDARLYFQTVRRDPALLRNFLYAFPKGGELHNHLDGAIYAESYIRWAAEDGKCIDLETYMITFPPCDQQAGRPAVSAIRYDADVVNRIIDAFSIRNYERREVSGHDQFFSTFRRFVPAGVGREGHMLAESSARSARQNVIYLELLQSWGMEQARQLAAAGAEFNPGRPLSELIRHPGIEALAAATSLKLDAIEEQWRAVLACGQEHADAGCGVTVRYLAQVIRTFPRSQVLAQTLLAYHLIEKDPRYVGLNFVAPEDNPVTLRDYRWQMEMIGELGAHFPSAKDGITLHAGEVDLGLVPPEHLGWHIRAALDLAGARRIGHGTDIFYDPQATQLMQRMAEQGILVEINLTSSDAILGITGDRHPIRAYLKYNVPVALSTDDEGVARIDLTHEYQRAVETYKLTYNDLKYLSRNALAYSFLPGESLLESTYTGKIVDQCDYGSAGDEGLEEDKVEACLEFMFRNDKAKLQAELERRFEEFEAGFPQESVQRFPFFGDLHVHSSWSLDSYVNFNRVGPREAYRFALGEEVVLSGGREVRIDRPLDFAAVTDHGEYLGELPLCTDESSAAYPLEICRDIRNEDGQERLIEKIYRNLVIRDVVSPDPQREPELCGADDARCLARAKLTWRELQDIAHEFNRPGVFTTFVGYEWTGNTHGNNMHRNVIYGNDQVPVLPASHFEANTPEQLWKQLHETCAAPCEVLAIPHNSNQSKGRQFPALKEDGSPLSSQWAELRSRTEPLVEIVQAKGESECHTGVGTVDELCDFEKFERRPLCTAGNTDEDCVQVCTGNDASKGCLAPGIYVRNALKLGLELERQLDVNPYKLGFIGSTDTHNGTPGGTDESNYQGHHGFEDGTPARRAGRPVIKEFAASRVLGSGGLAGVWAEQNSRAAIFAALQRRETFATSGTRISVRFFAGWDFPDALDTDTDPAALGYGKGVAMGSDLPAPGAGAAPGFIIWAMKDPQGVNLQRVQVVKGWLEQGGTREQVYDAVCADGLAPDPATRRCPDNGATVDLSDCSVSADKGAVELKTLWRDPDFDPRQPAFYYLRVLENPSCRWTTWEALREGNQLFEDIAPTIQERAWSSPIWYNPRS